MAQRTRGEKAEILGTCEVKNKRENRGQRDEDRSGQTPLRGVHANLLLETKPLPDHIRGLVQNLGQVASAFLVNEQGVVSNAQVLERHALQQVICRRAQVDTEVLLFETEAKLAADRLAGLSCRCA